MKRRLAGAVHGGEEAGGIREFAIGSGENDRIAPV